MTEETPAALKEYAKIPMSFLVKTVFHVEKTDPGRFLLSELLVTKPYVKDYDETENRVFGWQTKWDLKNWGFISAFEEGIRVGCAVIANDTAGIHMLEDRKDIAALWDIRVAPDHRGQGIGSKLFERVVAWAVTRRCSILKIETQSTNAPAIRFYQKMGCTLGDFKLRAYPNNPEEIQLIWHKSIG